MDQSPPPCGCVNELAHLTPSSTPKFLGDEELADLPEFVADHLREFERQDFSKVAYHEGAHAVCAASFGWPIELATVGSGGRFVRFSDVANHDPLQGLLVNIAGIAGEKLSDGVDRSTPDAEMVAAIARARAGQRGACDICKTAEELFDAVVVDSNALEDGEIATDD